MIIDILFAIMMLLAIFKGWSRGLIASLFSFLALVIGAAAALKLSAVLATNMQERFHWSYSWLPVVAFVVIFIAAALLIRVVAKLLEKAVQLIFLGWLNRLAGALLYMALYMVLFSIGLWLCNQVYALSPTQKIQSHIYEKIAPLGPRVIGIIGDWIPWFRDIFKELELFFERLAGRLQNA